MHIGSEMVERRPSTIRSMQGPAGEPFLPPGYRFHPTDEELVVYYLSNKVADCRFTVAAIGEVDLNKCEPWDLPERAKMGEKEWYFFSLKDRKYPTGLRTNRATMAGYWKATGKDREVMGLSRYGGGRYLVGMKKTLVFYKGRAPKGEKSNWIMHEYRLEGESAHLHLSTAVCKEEWVVCRIFKKNIGGKKISSQGSANLDEHALPALLESPHTHTGGGNVAEDMSGNIDNEQPVCDSLPGPHYHNGHGTTFATNCPPHPSLISGDDANVWSSMGTINSMNANVAGLRYSELSYNPRSDDSAYQSLLQNGRLTDNSNHKTGMHAGMRNLGLYPAPSTTAASELRAIVEQSSSSEGLCKAESTAAGVESQLTGLVQIYKDTSSSWSGSMMGSHNEEMAVNPELNTAHQTNHNTHNLSLMSIAANQTIMPSTSACSNLAMNQAMELLGDGVLISPAQLCDFTRAITATHHHHAIFRGGAVWASHY